MEFLKMNVKKFFSSFLNQSDNKHSRIYFFLKSTVFILHLGQSKDLTLKKLLLSLSVCFGIVSASFSQTTLFQDNFESGGGNWTLNTGSGDNNWVVNNAYTGFSGIIPNTPNQPGSFTNGPQSTYMHITNQSVCAGLSVCNANFDTGSASNQNTEITTSIDATNYTNVTVSFWYLCAGQTNVSYGTMEYSTNGGSTWTSTGTNYVNTSTWTQESVSLPAWDNVAAFKIRFKWQNGGGGLDPAFSIDEVLIEGTLGGGGSNSITTDTNIQPTSWCEGQAMTTQVNFTSTGTFNAGNIYTAQISDASGSFAAPTVIGTQASTANTGMIVGVIPGSMPAGTGYRIRVVSDNPATIGSDNGVDLVINANPTVTQAPFSDVCLGGGIITLVGASPAGGTYSGTGVTGSSFDPTIAGVGSTNISYSYTDGNGCSGNVSEPITVIPSPTVTLASFTNVCSTDPFFTITGGTPSGGTYTGPGVTGGVFDPSAAGVGVHTITYSFTDGNGCTATANSTITVEQCGGLSEENYISFQIQPNPVVNSFEIATEAIIETIQLLDLSGRVVKTFDTNQSIYSVEAVPAGIYLVRVGMDGKFSEQRIVVQ